MPVEKLINKRDLTGLGKISPVINHSVTLNKCFIFNNSIKIAFKF